MFRWLGAALKSRRILWAGFGLFLGAVVLGPVIFGIPGSNNQIASHPGTTEPDQDGDQDDPWWEYSGAWIAVFTVVLTGSTLALWWVTRQTLAHAERSSERQLRAYVFVQKVERTVSHQPSLRFMITIKNTGQTPAYGLRFLTLSRLIDAGDQTALDYETPSPEYMSIGRYTRFAFAYNIESVADGQLRYWITGNQAN